MNGSLDGLRVVDLSRNPPGQYCTMLLADLGADVIMVEQPMDNREDSGSDRGIERKSRIATAVRRNKRSIALDLKNIGDRQTCLALMANADIVVEGFLPGVAQRLGVGYASVSEVNPLVIYCSVSGYGQTGPYRNFPGHDINFMSINSILGMTGRRGGAPAIPPGTGDFAGGGLFAAFSILAAVNARVRTGKGQCIDMAMSDGILSLANLAVGEYFGSRIAPHTSAYIMNGALPCYNVYETADGKWV